MPDLLPPPAVAAGETVAHEKLREIFRRADVADLPAMSSNVQELLSLTSSARSAASDLAGVILRDYSLTNKVLRVVNSVIYALPKPVNNITRAVTVIGFEAVREIAAVIAIFEDFIAAGVDKDGVARVLTRSLLSGIQAKMLAVKKRLRVDPEEAFICALLHTFGQILVQVYLPGHYRQISERRAAGLSWEAAAREILQGLSFQDVGEEMARFWNLSPMLVAAMTPYPPIPRDGGDEKAYLQNLAAFTNGLTARICDGDSLAGLLTQFRPVLGLGRQGAIALLQAGVEAAEDFSPTIRSGLQKLGIRARLARFD